MPGRNFTELITEEGAKLGELRAFHSHESRMNHYIERACKNVRYDEKNLLEFVVCFLEVDPWFYGSGYLKETFLTRLKRSDLNDAIKERLRIVLASSVHRRGTREFKYYCRLAAILGGEGLVSALEKASESTDRAVAYRAKLMLYVIRQRQHASGQRRAGVS